MCAARWLEAYHANKAPPVDLEATSVAALTICKLEELAEHATDETHKIRALQIVSEKNGTS